MVDVTEEQTERTIARAIMLNNNLCTIWETDEFCLYNGGYFHKGTEPMSNVRTNINTIAKEILLPTKDPNVFKPYYYSISKRNTIIEMIKTDTFTSINEFDKDPQIICIKNGLYKLNSFDNCLLPNPLTKDGSYNTSKSHPLVFGKKNFLTFDEYINRFEKPYKTFIQVPTEYNPKAECLIIDQFLTDIFGFDTVPLVYEMIAYFLMPHIRYQKAFILYGPPSSGKTTFITMLWKFLDGLKNFSGVSLQDLGERFQMINVMGTILNVFDDLPDDPIGDTKSFRQIVTNEYLDSEVKHLPEHVKWHNRTKILVSSNDLPPVRKKEGNPFFRRWILIACYNTFKETDLMTQEDIDDPTISPKDNNLIKKLCTPEEFSGLINKIIEAWIRLEKRGYFPKEWNDTEYIKNLWMINTNPVQLFVNECCTVGNVEKTDYEIFYHTLNKFRAEHNAKPITKHACTQWLHRIPGIKKKRKTKSPDYYYDGISINDSSKSESIEVLYDKIELEEEEDNLDQFLEAAMEKTKKEYEEENL